MLTFHIIAGSFLLFFGLGALIFAKGKTNHRWSGNFFFFAMILMAGSAAFLNQGTTMALLTLYYGLTAWVTVLRKEKSTGIIEILLMLVIAYVSVDLFYYVFTTPDIPETFKVIFTIHASVAAMCACLDLKMILNGGIAGKHRIVRHTWRACYAFLGAVMSFSANTSDRWPEFIDSNALIYLMIGVLFYWLIRLLFTSWFNQLKGIIGDSLLIRKIIAYRRPVRED